MTSGMEPRSPTSPPPDSQTSPAAATPAPPATHATAKGKGPAPLSPDAAPFFPTGTPGRSKAVRWSEDSDFEDSDVDSVQVWGSAYADAVRRGSPAHVVDSAMGTSARPTACAVEVPPAEASPVPGSTATPPRRARRRRRRKRARKTETAPAFQPGGRTPTQHRPSHRSGPEMRPPSDRRRERVSVHLRLGEHGRLPVHQRLGARVPPRGHRRISPPDADGWREVLSRSPDGRPMAKGCGSPLAARPRAPRRRRIPEAMRDRCLNCLSFTHKIATCRRPLRCLHCHGPHFARECKRPRSPTTGGGNGGGCAAGHDVRFVRARHTPDIAATPTGSQAGGSTPASSDADPAGPEPDDREPLPPGHPDERPLESICIIQRTTAMDDAEASLRLAITAVAADGTRDISVADAYRALRTVHGVDDGSFSIFPFFPEHFLIRCHTPEARERLLAAPPIPIAGTALVLLPWTRLAHAEPESMQYRVTVELEGIPPHAWAEDTAAKLLAPSCWIQSIDGSTTNSSDLSTFKVTAWTRDPRTIPKVVRLYIAENEVRFGSLPPYLRRKGVLRYQVIVHLRSVHDFNPPNPSPPPSPPESDDGGSGRDGNPDRHHFHRGSAPRIHGFRCTHGAVDGEPTTAGAGTRGGNAWSTGVSRRPQCTALHDGGNFAGNAKSSTNGQGPRGKLTTVLCSLGADNCQAVPGQTPFNSNAAGGQPASGPMVLEAGLLSEQALPRTDLESTMDANPPQLPVQSEPMAPIAVTTSSQDGSPPTEPPAPRQRDNEAISNDCVAASEKTAPSTAATKPPTTSTDGPVGDSAQPAQVSPEATASEALGCAATVAAQGSLHPHQESMPSGDGTSPTADGGHGTPPEQQAGTSAPVQDTATPREAARRLAKFAKEVQVSRPAPLIASQPKQKDVPRKHTLPLRSRRIAAQKLGHIPASKRGEVLLMKKMGFAPPQAAPSSAAKKSFDALFTANLSDNDVAAFDDMFPAARPRTGRALRQNSAAVA